MLALLHDFLRKVYNTMISTIILLLLTPYVNNLGLKMNEVG